MSQEDVSSQKACRPRMGEEQLNSDSYLLAEQLNPTGYFFSCMGLTSNSVVWILGKMSKTLSQDRFLTAPVFCGQKQRLLSCSGCDCARVPQLQTSQVLGSRFPSGASRVPRPEHPQCWSSYWPLTCCWVLRVNVAILPVSSLLPLLS